MPTTERTMDGFSDCLLIKVFKWLEMRDLLRSSLVCKRWKYIVYDSTLWIDVDLRPYRWKLDEYSINRMIFSRFKPCLRTLNLSGFSLTPKLFHELEIHCPNITGLILENVTFIGFIDSIHKKFPSHLQLLDLRYSSGDTEAFTLIASQVTHLKCFGVTNNILENLNVVELFQNLQYVTTLDFSFCNSLYDATLILIGAFCSQLRSLSLSHCNNVNGRNLYMLTDGCKKLKSLSFSGTSLTDANLTKCNWDGIELEELDVSWCRNITEIGLMSILPTLNHLIYLRLCSCGFGHAITDRVLSTLSSNGFPQLEILDVSYSREISNYGTSKLICSLPALKQIRISCCRRLTMELLNTSNSVNSNILIIASFQEQNNTTVNQSHFGSFLLVPDLERAPNKTLRKYSFESQLERY